MTRDRRAQMRGAMLHTLEAYATNLSEYDSDEREEIYDCHPLLEAINDLTDLRPSDYAIVAAVCKKHLISDALEMMDEGAEVEDAEVDDPRFVHALIGLYGLPSLLRREEEARAYRRSHRYHDHPSHPLECQGKTCPCHSQG